MSEQADGDRSDAPPASTDADAGAAAAVEAAVDAAVDAPGSATARTPEQAPDPARPDRRRNPMVQNMVWSLIPLVAVIVIVSVIISPRGHARLTPIDPSADISYARQHAGVAAIVPAGLPADWQPTSSHVDDRKPATLRVGYQTPAGQFARYVESTGGLQPLVTSTIDGARRTGVVRIGGRLWTSYDGTDGQHALASRIGALSVAVGGTAGETEIRILAAALR